MVKPILFNTEMVKAILDGRKTCTRRIIKQQPIMQLCYICAGSNCLKWNYPSKTASEFWGEKYKRPENFPKEAENCYWNPPYHTGDIIYVRETWVYDNQNEKYLYRASKETYSHIGTYDDIIWHPSIHMPKAAARIWLKVIGVRVERLQDMTDDDAIKEGIYQSNCKNCRGSFGCDCCPDEGYDEIDAFAELWNSTIKKSAIEDFGWEANPFVWVIEFERCEKH